MTALGTHHKGWQWESTRLLPEDLDAHLGDEGHLSTCLRRKGTQGNGTRIWCMLEPGTCTVRMAAKGNGDEPCHCLARWDRVQHWGRHQCTCDHARDAKPPKNQSGTTSGSPQPVCALHGSPGLSSPRQCCMGLSPAPGLNSLAPSRYCITLWQGQMQPPECEPSR